MQWRVPSSLAAITSLFLLPTVHLVAAQISAPLCTDEVSWLWVRVHCLYFMQAGLRSTLRHSILLAKARVQL